MAKKKGKKMFPDGIRLEHFSDDEIKKLAGGTCISCNAEVVESRVHFATLMVECTGCKNAIVMPPQVTARYLAFQRLKELTPAITTSCTSMVSDLTQLLGLDKEKATMLYEYLVTRATESLERELGCHG